MKILIVRHGEAVGAHVAGGDENRYLTPNGRATSDRVAAALDQLGHTPTHIYTSPLVRAVQTAERFAHAASHPGPVVTHRPLVPGGPTAQALAVLEAHGDTDTIALVSHEPTVSTLSAFLTQSRPLGFPTSGVAVLDGNAHGARLIGRFDPISLSFST
ncbi:MAG: histidine phosphatase family protein [Sandaracinaceae bacterium]